MSGEQNMCERMGIHAFQGRTDRKWPYEGQPCCCGERQWSVSLGKSVAAAVPSREPEGEA